MPCLSPVNNAVTCCSWRTFAHTHTHTHTDSGGGDGDGDGDDVALSKQRQFVSAVIGVELPGLTAGEAVREGAFHALTAALAAPPTGVSSASVEAVLTSATGCPASTAVRVRVVMDAAAADHSPWLEPPEWTVGNQPFGSVAAVEALLAPWFARSRVTQPPVVHAVDVSMSTGGKVSPADGDEAGRRKGSGRHAEADKLSDRRGRVLQLCCTCPATNNTGNVRVQIPIVGGKTFRETNPGVTIGITLSVMALGAVGFYVYKRWWRRHREHQRTRSIERGRASTNTFSLSFVVSC